MPTNTVAVFTTVYPEGKKYLSDFFSSLTAQTDQDFDLWIGFDRLQSDELNEYIHNDSGTTCIERKKSESNISLRQDAIEKITKKYDGVVFVDSDDILAPSRVAAARSSLEKYEVYGCAMKIIDEDGSDLGISFHLPSGSHIKSLLPRFNVFGMSNTCYSTETLKKCLPFPSDCVLLDWFVATRAWARGSSMVFDPVQRMSYRQHSANTARVIPPFTPEQIQKATNLVLQHYHLVLTEIPELRGSKCILIENAQKYVESFEMLIQQNPRAFQKYVQRINALPPNHIWWSCVAHPDLEEVWKN
jgi:glycosyltransferase involved in cell wall biosynthesis